MKKGKIPVPGIHYFPPELHFPGDPIIENEQYKDYLRICAEDNATPLNKEDFYIVIGQQDPWGNAEKKK